MAPTTSPGRSTRPTADAALLALLCALGPLSCARGTAILFSVSNLPAGAAALETRAVLDDTDAKERTTFPLQAQGGQAYVFGYRLPEGARGALTVSVAARDARGCLLTTGTARLDPATAQGNVDLPLDPVDPDRLVQTADCFTGAPEILQLLPVPGAAGQIRVKGWGFDRGVQVGLSRLADDPTAKVPIPCLAPTRSRPACDLRGAQPVPASMPQVSRVSPTELVIRDEAVLPTQAKSGRLGLCVRVSNPDGQGHCLATDGDSEILTVTFAQTRYGLDRSLHPDALVIADLDGDGKQDLAMSAQSRPDDPNQAAAGTLLYLLNRGGGAFPGAVSGGVLQASPERIALAGTGRSLATADLDRDGRPDLVMSAPATNEVVLFLNQGAPGLFRREGQPRYPAGPRPDSIATGDFDGDGLTDLAVVNDTPGTSLATAGVTLLRNVNRAERLAAPDSYFVGLGVFFAAVGELDGTPGLDLVSNGIRPFIKDGMAQSDMATGGILVLRNGGAGALTPRYARDVQQLPEIAAAQIAVGGTFGAVVVEDVDGDGRPDILCSGAVTGGRQDQGSVISMLFNQGAGAFRVEEYPAGKAPFSIGVADFNNDGLKDVVVTNGFTMAAGTVTLLLQQRGAAAGARFPLSNLPTYPAGVDSGAVAIGDLDGDGRPDMAVANFGTVDSQDPRRSQPGTLTVYLNTTR
jgi:hypothetical protein